MLLRRLLLRRSLAAALLAACVAVPVQAVDNPSTLTGGAIVTAEKAKELFGKGGQIVDVRSANEFAEGHIKGARNVPYKEKSDKKASFDAALDTFDLSKLGGDKNVGLIFYCNGIECWKSYKASVLAIKAGYKNIHWLRGGLPEWKAKGYEVE